MEPQNKEYTIILLIIFILSFTTALLWIVMFRKPIDIKSMSNQTPQQYHSIKKEIAIDKATKDFNKRYKD